ncbi:hypothetical protein [Mesorhizobium sp.]|nr:hypothetical protein [Mesorhizobium sp.]
MVLQKGYRRQGGGSGLHEGPGEICRAQQDLERDLRPAIADAPWASVLDEQRFTMKSARMGGVDNLYIDPVHVFSYNNLYAKDVQ